MESLNDGLLESLNAIITIVSHFSFNKYNNQSLFFFRYLTSVHLVFKMVLNREVVLESRCQHYVDAWVNTQHILTETRFFLLYGTHIYQI